MITALDSSVILDIVGANSAFATPSLGAIRKAAAEGSLIICECVLAEIRPALNSKELEEMLSDWSLAYVASSKESALLAGSMQKKYLKRAQKNRRVLPDFLIGAHAVCHADRLLARDRGYYRDYFTGLSLIQPGIQE